MRLLLAFVLGAVCVYALRRKPEACGDSTWLPYEDEEGFGYREWFCEQPRGHDGDHAGWLRDLERVDAV